MPFHWVETNANQVTQSAFDPISREPNYKQCAVVRVEPGALDERRLVVVGNGMAGVACVEQILQARAGVRHHDFRRRDARQLQPHPAVVGAGRREGRRRDHAQPARVVPAQQHPPPRRRAGHRRRRRPQGRHDRRRRASTAFDTLLLATGSSRVDAADRGRRQGRRLRVPHARRHARAARAREARRQGRRHRRRTARPRSRARPAGAGLRRHRRPPDGHADGAAARSTPAASI